MLRKQRKFLFYIFLSALLSSRPARAQDITATDEKASAVILRVERLPAETKALEGKPFSVAYTVTWPRESGLQLKSIREPDAFLFTVDRTEQKAETVLKGGSAEIRHTFIVHLIPEKQGKGRISPFAVTLSDESGKEIKKITASLDVEIINKKILFRKRLLFASAALVLSLMLFVLASFSRKYFLRSGKVKAAQREDERLGSLRIKYSGLADRARSFLLDGSPGIFSENIEKVLYDFFSEALPGTPAGVFEDIAGGRTSRADKETNERLRILAQYISELKYSKNRLSRFESERIIKLAKKIVENVTFI
jgi:hypothetical protein